MFSTHQRACYEEVSNVPFTAFLEGSFSACSRKTLLSRSSNMSRGFRNSRPMRIPSYRSYSFESTAQACAVCQASNIALSCLPLELL